MKNLVKKPSWWEEFKTFAIKGNAMALAVGTIIGGAFSTITKSLTNDLIMPISRTSATPTISPERKSLLSLTSAA